MLPWRTDRATRGLVLAAALLAVVGCAATSTKPPAGPDEVAATTDASSSARVDATRRESTSKVEVDGPFGFTVTEAVRIGSDVRNDYQRAAVLLEQDQLMEGISLLTTVVERAPEVTVPHIDLGVAYGRLGDFEKAEQSLTKALSLAPNHPVALNEMGILFRKTGKFDAARDHYQRALAVYPDYHFALRNLGVLCDLYLEDLTCALDNYQRYAEIVRDDAEVGIWIADIRNRLGVIEEE